MFFSLAPMTLTIIKISESAARSILRNQELTADVQAYSSRIQVIRFFSPIQGKLAAAIPELASEHSSAPAMQAPSNPYDGLTVL
jgi:hypothetical protein